MLRNLNRPSRLCVVAARPIRRNFASKDSASIAETIVNTDNGSKTVHKLYHSSAYVLALLTPLAFVISPSVYNMPIDITLGFLFPMHSHVALNCVISDYVPKALQSSARGGLLGVTIVSILGLLKLNIGGVGMTESIKSLWRKKKSPSK